MSFDAMWRLKRRTFDPGELRGAVEEVARELGVARVEWREGRQVEQLEAYLWLPAALVRAHDLPGLREQTMEGEDLLSTQLELSFYRGGPEPLDVSVMSHEPNETLLDMVFSRPPARAPGAIAVGSTVFASRHATWHASSDSAVPDTEEGYLRCVRQGRDGELWMGTEDGKLYRNRRGEWTRFEVATESIDALCVVSPTRIFLSLMEGDLLEFDGEKVVRRWPELRAERVVDTAEGPVLVGMQELRRLEEGEWRKVRLPSDFAVFALAVDCRRRLWLANQKAVFLWDGSQLIPTPVRCDDDAPAALAVHDENDIWVAGFRGELVHWDGAAIARVALESTGGASLAIDGCGRALVLSKRMYQVSRSSGVSLHISSKRSSNRQAWGALSELCARVATRLDGYFVES